MTPRDPSAHSMRIVFFGTPDFAVPVLNALAASGTPGWDVVMVVTPPDRPSGRGNSVQAPAVKVAAAAYGLQVYQPPTLRNDEAVTFLRAVHPDVGVLFSYAQLIPRSVLKLFPFGIVNVHPSLLPAYRGPSPIATAILDGVAETGVSLIKLVPRMDAGPIIAQERVAVPPDATTPTLTSILSSIGARMVQQALTPWVNGLLPATPQVEAAATYCQLLTREDGQVRWSEAAFQIERRIRALQPWPGTFTTWNGKTLKILDAGVDDAPVQEPPGTVVRSYAPSAPGMRVATGQGVLVVRTLQAAGGRAMEGEAFLRGQPSLAGSRLGTEDLTTLTAQDDAHS